jgi:hypothetical protein
MVIEQMRRQTLCAEMELIIIAPTRDGMETEEFDSFGAVQWIQIPRHQTCGMAMEAGVRAANAPFVTYAEEHSYFAPTWAERLVEAHARGYDVVGFAMENANPRTLTSWAHLYGQFGPVVAPTESRESDFLAGHHVSYRKNLLLGYDGLLHSMLEDESALFLDLRAKGNRLFIAGDAISRHINISKLGAYIHMDFVGQRSFAAARASVGKWNWWKRVLYASATPLVPWIRLRRILKDIRRTGRQAEMLPKVLAPISVALVAGAWGEMLGYVLGAGDSAEKKAPVELQREKFVAKSDGWSHKQ